MMDYLYYDFINNNITTNNNIYELFTNLYWPILIYI